MTKVRGPLMSFAASGPVGKDISYRKRGRETVAERRPVVSDQQTWRQRRHRFDYQNYAVWWRQLSEADKDTWRAAGRPLGITGFNAWMRDRLTTLPDIAGRWWLDEEYGSVVRDSGKLGNDGTILGALWVPGPMNGGLWFDANDDRVDLPANGDLRITGGLSLEFGLELYANSIDGGVVIWTPDGGNGYRSFIGGSALCLYDFGGTHFYGLVALGLHVKRHVIVTWEPDLAGNELKVYRDHSLVATRSSAGDIDYTGVTRLHLGRRQSGANKSIAGTIFYAVVYNRVLRQPDVDSRYAQWESEL